MLSCLFLLSLMCVCIYTYLPNHKCVDRQVLALPNCKVFGLITVAGRDERRQTSIAQCQHLVWSSVELLAGFDGIGSGSKRGWTGSRMRPWRSTSMLSTSCASASAANWNLATVSSYRLISFTLAIIELFIMSLNKRNKKGGKSKCPFLRLDIWWQHSYFNMNNQCSLGDVVNIYRQMPSHPRTFS